VADDSAEIRATVARLFAQGLPQRHRSERAAEFLACLERVDTAAQPTPQDVRAIYTRGDA
jgi:malonate decarboxylase beta subunit